MTRRTRPTLRRSGLSFVEVVISTMVVGLILVASLKTVGAVLRQRTSLADDQRAYLLGEQLMSEILENEYLEPDTTPGFGTETGESSSDRTNYDDVDDFHGWNAAPPTHRDGSAISGLADWKREVVVEWVDPDDPKTAVGADQGVKRITVGVRKSGKLLATLQSLQTDHD